MRKKSWVEIPANSDFPIENLPYGIFSTASEQPRAGVAIGTHILDLAAVADLGFFDDLEIDRSVFKQSTLNAFIGLGKSVWSATRKRIGDLLSEGNALAAKRSEVLVSASAAKMYLPVQIGDYTDFYSSIEHATNVGKMFRDPERALMPNWRHLPVGYHGRASSIVVSGTDVYRPWGQTMPPNAEKPVFGPSKRMDFELEMAFIAGKSNTLGEPIPVAEAEDYIFGMLLFNDWSARDIQKWEYVPLGPFLGKNFASSVSPWLVTMEALAPFRTENPTQNPQPLPYLRTEGKKGYDINLEVWLKPQNSEENLICRSNFKYMYWNMAQQLAHHTVNGCNVQVGDMYASGTISGKDKGSYGSMLELSWAGTQTIALKNGMTRQFLEDNDTVIMRAYAQKADLRVGFGQVRSTLLPAKKIG